jgi:hypothetical protein
MNGYLTKMVTIIQFCSFFQNTSSLFCQCWADEKPLPMLSDSPFLLYNCRYGWKLCTNNGAIHKVMRLGGENGQFQHNRASNV